VDADVIGDDANVEDLLLWLRYSDDDDSSD
jgi:hypothetical protein